jgi:hypothetical protein
MKYLLDAHGHTVPMPVTGALVPFTTTEKGYQTAIEAVVLDDARTLDVNLEYRHQGPIVDSEHALYASIVTSFVAKPESGTVIQVWTLASRRSDSGEKIHMAALILRPAVVANAGRIMNQVHPPTSNTTKGTQQ